MAKLKKKKTKTGASSVTYNCSVAIVDATASEIYDLTLPGTLLGNIRKCDSWH